ncbi:MAG: DUF362 domain-containing protein [Succinivibrio sp.]|nr:DUF362 domain-containing protein [Succinivibrio sp.]
MQLKNALLISVLSLACLICDAAESSYVQKFPLHRLEHRVRSSQAPRVYFTRQLDAKGLVRAFEALGIQPQGRVAVKISTGEAGNSHYLAPELIADLVTKLKATLVECNTAYPGARFETQSHLQVAKEHGFTAIAPVDIMDSEGEISLPVTGGTYLKEDLVGSHLANYDFLVVLSHFKGHAMGGFGGGLKNASIGIASKRGKNLIHSAGHFTEEVFGRNGGGYLSNDTQEHLEFIAAMAEAAKAVSDYMDHGKRVVYLNVLNHISVDCDCDSHPSEPDMHDLGILASADAVACDQAALDLIFAAPDGASVQERVTSRQGEHILEHAVKMQLGARHYQLIELDDQR